MVTPDAENNFLDWNKTLTYFHVLSNSFLFTLVERLEADFLVMACCVLSLGTRLLFVFFAALFSICLKRLGVVVSHLHHKGNPTPCL